MPVARSTAMIAVSRRCAKLRPAQACSSRLSSWQLHLDIRVNDANQAEQELLALGATRVPGERETGFRVFTDPAGHPFCIVFGGHSTG
jgi:hypothetical protein